MIFCKNHGNMRKRCGNHRFLLVVKVGDLLKKNNLEKIRSSFFFGFGRLGLVRQKIGGDRAAAESCGEQKTGMVYGQAQFLSLR